MIDYYIFYEKNGIGHANIVRSDKSPDVICDYFKHIKGCTNVYEIKVANSENFKPGMPVIVFDDAKLDEYITNLAHELDEFGKEYDPYGYIDAKDDYGCEAFESIKRDIINKEVDVYCDYLKDIIDDDDKEFGERANDIMARLVNLKIKEGIKALQPSIDIKKIVSDECDSSKKFDFVLENGQKVELTMNDMSLIKKKYEVECTAEYIAENYDIHEDLVMEVAELTRRYMDKYDFTESEAVQEVLADKSIININRRNKSR